MGRNSSSYSVQNAKERRPTLVVPYNLDSSGGPTTQESMTIGYHQDPILLAHGGQGSSAYSINAASGGSSWVSPYPRYGTRGRAKISTLEKPSPVRSSNRSNR